jgi:hypothetical protein
MQDVLTLLNGLRRPRLLIRTARLGAEDYRRDIHLSRHLGYGRLPRSGEALMSLIEIESELDEMRRADSTGYSLVRHVDVLIAMMGEARLLRASLEVSPDLT